MVYRSIDQGTMTTINGATTCSYHFVHSYDGHGNRKQVEYGRNHYAGTDCSRWKVSHAGVLVVPNRLSSRLEEAEGVAPDASLLFE